MSSSVQSSKNVPLIPNLPKINKAVVGIGITLLAIGIITAAVGISSLSGLHFLGVINASIFTSGIILAPIGCIAIVKAVRTSLNQPNQNPVPPVVPQPVPASSDLPSGAPDSAHDAENVGDNNVIINDDGSEEQVHQAKAHIPKKPRKRNKTSNNFVPLDLTMLEPQQAEKYRQMGSGCFMIDMINGKRQAVLKIEEDKFALLGIQRKVDQQNYCKKLGYVEFKVFNHEEFFDKSLMEEIVPVVELAKELIPGQYAILEMHREEFNCDLIAIVKINKDTWQVKFGSDSEREDLQAACERKGFTERDYLFDVPASYCSMIEEGKAAYEYDPKLQETRMAIKSHQDFDHLKIVNGKEMRVSKSKEEAHKQIVKITEKYNDYFKFIANKLQKGDFCAIKLDNCCDEQVAAYAVVIIDGSERTRVELATERQISDLKAQYRNVRLNEVSETDILETYSQKGIAF